MACHPCGSTNTCCDGQASLLPTLRLHSPGRSDEDAFKQSVECITGPISRIISSKGMPAVYEALDAQGKETFKQVRALIATSFGFFL